MDLDGRRVGVDPGPDLGAAGRVDRGPLDASAPAPRRLQRAEGRARIAFHHRHGATRLDRLFQEGCAKVRLPRLAGGAPPEAVLINTAGGLAGGDRLALEVALGAGAAASVTTQACERVYRSTGEDAQVAARLAVGPGARLAWLPQETILFEGGRLSRRLEADLAPDAELLLVEAVLFGRLAMGETVRTGRLRERWRVRRDGRLILADEVRVEGEVDRVLARPATLGGSVAMATVALVAPDAERRLEGARALLGAAGGASAWDGKLVLRLVARDGLALRRRLEPVLTRLLDGRTLPKVWQI